MSLQGLKRRVENLEIASGINETCPACELSILYERRAEEMTSALGISLPKPSEKDLMRVRCIWCWRSHNYNMKGYTQSERALCERVDIVYEQGTLCASENTTLLDETQAAHERVTRERYGAHYEAFRGLFDERNRELSKVAEKHVLRQPYLCRIEGCGCDYPKSVEEYLATMPAAKTRRGPKKMLGVRGGARE